MRFSDFAQVHGLLIRDLYPSQRIQRCPTANKPTQKNGAYSWDGERGWVFAWDGDATIHFYGSTDRPWTEQEKTEWKRRRDAEMAGKVRQQRKAAETAQSMISQAKFDVHGYLTLKGFPTERGLVRDDVLLVPMRSFETGALQTVQQIAWDESTRKWEKKMLFGGKAKGAIYRIGSKTAPETFLCEGYATGLSIALALRSAGSDGAVLVCFSTGNIEYVAPQVKGRKYIYADNDASKAGEAAAIKTGVPYCMSDTVGNDANDDHQKAGIFSVIRKLMEVRRK